MKSITNSVLKDNKLLKSLKKDTKTGEGPLHKTKRTQIEEQVKNNRSTSVEPFLKNTLITSSKKFNLSLKPTLRSQIKPKKIVIEPILLSIEEFIFHESLGNGKYGYVYRAELKKNPKIEVAIKMISKSNVIQYDCLTQLKSEIEIHSRLK